MNRKKHIAILLGYGLSGSGSAVYSADLADSLVEQGMNVSTFCHESRVSKINQGSTIEIKSNKIKYCLSEKSESSRVYSMFTGQTPVAYDRPELGNTSILSSYDLDKISTYVKQVKEFIKYIHKTQPIDYIIVNHLGLLVPVATLLQTEFDIPYSVVVHGTFIEYVLKKNKIVKNIVSSSISSASKVIALNQSVKNRLVECFDGLNLPIELVPPGVNLNNFMLRDKNLAQEGEGNKKICFVGRLSFDKGLHCLLAAAPSILCDNNTELHIAGDGPDKDFFMSHFWLLAKGRYIEFYEKSKKYLYEKRGKEVADLFLCPLKSYVNKVQVTNQIIDPTRVKWLGNLDRDKVSELYKDSKFNVLTSLIPEAHPLVICEAMACGTLTIGSDFSGIEYIFDGIGREIPSLGNAHRVSFDMNRYINSLIKSCRYHLSLSVNNILEQKLINYSKKRYSWNDLSRKLVSDKIFM